MPASWDDDDGCSGRSPFLGQEGGDVGIVDVRGAVLARLFTLTVANFFLVLAILEAGRSIRPQRQRRRRLVSPRDGRHRNSDDHGHQTLQHCSTLHPSPPVIEWK